MGAAATPSQWAIDLGTGAGFNAFNIAQLDYRTVATDPAAPMLREARRIGAERGLTNLTLCQTPAGISSLCQRVFGHCRLPNGCPSLW
jgi:ubiquinone/menaquinone biosynthesis C-methylase UbiE